MKGFITVRLENEEREKLCAICRQEGRSMSATVRLLIKKLIEGRVMIP